MAVYESGKVLDKISWKEDLAKATTTEIYNSSEASLTKKMPRGVSVYWRVYMTGGGDKLGGNFTPYPIMLRLTEYSDATSPNGFQRFWPFPGVPGAAHAICYIPLVSPGLGGADGAAFKFEVASATAGTNDHTSANGNQGELQAELVVGDHREEETYWINHSQASQSYALNDKISSFYCRRASAGSLRVSTDNGTYGYRVRTFGHRAYDEGNITEGASNITTGTTTTSVNLAAADTWYQPVTFDLYCGGTMTSANITTNGIIKGH